MAWDLFQILWRAQGAKIIGVNSAPVALPYDVSTCRNRSHHLRIATLWVNVTIVAAQASSD